MTPRNGSDVKDQDGKKEQREKKKINFPGKEKKGKKIAQT